MKFNSDYADVEYIKNDNAVLLTWKKEAHKDDYRNPTWFALEQLKKYKVKNFIVDARNGFEDEKCDVEWGFNVLLPKMAETLCKKVIFIMNEVNEIEDEMNMWTMEFKKYFEVYSVNSYENAMKIINA